MQLRIVTLQIIVIICEFQNSNLIRERQEEAPSPTDVFLTQQIFLNMGLLEILIRKVLQDDGNMTLEEVRFVARGFNALPADLLIKENIGIFDQVTVLAHEKRLQEEYDQNPGMKMPMNRGD